MALAHIEYMGKAFVFDKPSHLNDQQFYDRCWFIVKNDGVEFIEAYADIWLAITYHGAMYAPELQRIVEKLASTS